MQRKFRLSLMGFLAIGLGTLLNAAMFQTVPAQKAQLVQKGVEKQFCTVCGMNLVMFYKTDYAALVNGKEKQYCSLHCLTEDMDKNHANLQNIRMRF